MGDDPFRSAEEPLFQTIMIAVVRVDRQLGERLWQNRRQLFIGVATRPHAILVWFVDSEAGYHAGYIICFVLLIAFMSMQLHAETVLSTPIGTAP